MKIKRTLFLCILFSLFFNSCSKMNQKDFDKVVIKLYGLNGDYLETVSQFLITDKAEIDKISNFVSFRPAPWYKGGYHGEVLFYNSNQEICSFEFNIYESDRHCIFQKGNKFKSRYLTNEGYKYLKALYDTLSDEQKK